MYNLGLTTKQAEEFLSQYGLNELASKDKNDGLKILLRQFKTPLIYVLIFASVISFALDELKDSIFILIVVLINVSLGFIQEYRAEKSLEKLKEGISQSVKVQRDGKKIEIETKFIVPGDIVFIEPGIRIPADGKIVQSTDVLIDESVITGESMPVEKSESDKADRNNQLYMGTVAVGGLGIMKVTKTGEETTYGKIADGLKAGTKIKTPTQKRLSFLSKILTVGIILISIFVVLVGLIQGREANDILLTSIALGVSTIPEGLIIAYTVVLALGMNRIVKKKAIVRNLPAAETLGGVDVLCIDKTGTITLGKMKVQDVYTQDKEAILYALTLSNNDTNFVDLTIKDYITEQKGESYWFDRQSMRRDQIPFSSKFKYTAAFDGEKITMVGSPEAIIKATSSGEDIKNEILEIAKKGVRVVAVASKWVNTDFNKDHISHDDLNNMKFEGFIAIKDPPRENVKENIEKVLKAGIEVKIITGDLKDTTLGILSNIGFEIKDNEILSGAELKEYENDPKFIEHIRNIKLFYRTTPDQKLSIVQALQSKGLNVGMMGDGVNDSPAIKNAEIGITVDSATDVSKEASDIVLLDSNFKTIVDAISEGRNIFLNLKKIFIYLLTHSLSETILVLLAIIFDIPLPLIPLQILWINLIEDGLPSIALAFDKTNQSLLTKSHKDDNKKILDPFLFTSIISISIIIDTIFFAFYKILLDSGYETQTAQTMIFAGISFSSLLFLFSAKTINSNIWKENIFNNLVVNLSVILGFNLLIAAIYLEPLQNLLNTVALSFEQVLLVVLISIIDIIIIEAAKILIRKVHD